MSRARAALHPNPLSSDVGGFLFVRCERKCRVKDGMLPSDFFRPNVVLSFQEDAIGIRLRDVIGVDNMMWGSDHPHSESTFPQSRKILAEIEVSRDAGKAVRVSVSVQSTTGFGSPLARDERDLPLPSRSKERSWPQN